MSYEEKVTRPVRVSSSIGFRIANPPRFSSKFPVIRRMPGLKSSCTMSSVISFKAIWLKRGT